MMVDLGVPLCTGQYLSICLIYRSRISHLCLDVVEGWGADDGEADEEYVGLGIRQWSQSVVVFLASSVPQSEADGLSIHHDARGVVVEPVSKHTGQQSQSALPSLPQA